MHALENDTVAPASTPNIVLLERANTPRSAFCIHAVDGSVRSYIELAHELASAGISAYGVQALDLNGHKPLEATMASIAAQYVQQARNVHSNGAFHLVGWSIGALIAFEMARCLSKLGAVVGEVILMDPCQIFDHDNTTPLDPSAFSNNLRSLLPPFNEPNANVWWNFLTLISAYIDCSDTYPLAPQFWEMDDAGKSEYLFLNQHNPRLINPNCMLADARNAGDILYMFNIVKQQYAALSVYQPSNFDGKLNLFVAVNGDPSSSEKNASQIEYATRHWSRVSQGIAHVQPVPDGHIGMMRNPCVGQIARRIQLSTA